MKIKIEKNTLDSIKNVEGKMLLKDQQIFSIKNVEYVSEEENYGFRNNKTRFVYYLTNIKMSSYNVDGEYLGGHSIDNIKYLVTMYDLKQLRYDWIRLRKQIEGFGFEIKEKVKTNPLGEELV